MNRATDVEKAQRVNLAYTMLREERSVPDTVRFLQQSYRISRRQAYRYLDEARSLKQPLAIGDVTVALTVRISRELVKRVRRYAESSGLTVSEITQQGLLALLRREAGRARKHKPTGPAV